MGRALLLRKRMNALLSPEASLGEDREMSEGQWRGEYDFIQSESSSGVDRLIKMMINNGYETIVIVGGDSALNDAVNCLMRSHDSSVRGACRARRYSNGLMNDFAHFWGFRESDYSQTIKWLKQRHVRKD